LFPFTFLLLEVHENALLAADSAASWGKTEDGKCGEMRAAPTGEKGVNAQKGGETAGRAGRFSIAPSQSVIPDLSLGMQFLKQE